MKENERLREQVHFERDRANRRGERIKAARALHKEQAWSGRCEVCERAYPCPTVKALKS